MTDTGLWHVNADGCVRERLEPERRQGYDCNAISALVVDLEYQDRYEELASDPGDTLSTVLTTFGLDAGVASTISPGTAKLANSEKRK